MRRTGVVVFAGAVLAFGGCAVFNSGDSITEIAPEVRNANWGRAERVEVIMADYEFDPASMTFQAGQPYKLALRNVGTKEHYFVADEFFANTQSYMIEQGNETTYRANVQEIELHPGNSLMWYFIPTQRGTYDLICTKGQHAEKGMTGTIVVK